jgi:hypothetical protein
MLPVKFCFILALWFQRRRFSEIDQPETELAAMFVNGYGAMSYIYKDFL